jgi:dephospho-CoA kinase
MVVIGLTGSLGMGKTTTSRFFAEAGVPVYDADETVHRLYAGEAAAAIEAAFPGTTGKHGVDRAKLAQAVLGDAAALARLEAIVHPLVRGRSSASSRRRARQEQPIAVLDIRCCSRPAATAGSMPSPWCRRRPTCSAPARSSVPA